MHTCIGTIKNGIQCRKRIKKEYLHYCHLHNNQELSSKLSNFKLDATQCEDPVTYTPYNADIDKCILHVTHNKKGALLGKGEQGATYEFDKLVIKVITLKNKRGKSLWFQEACIGQKLGLLGIAPKVHDYFVCSGKGFIIMDRLTTIKSRKTNSENDAIRLFNSPNRTDVVRYKWDYVCDRHTCSDSLDDLRNLTDAQQLGFISALEKMIDNGFIHMDNHIDNLGFFGKNKTPILFDFGFTQERSKIDRRWALSFSVFQILEHCSPHNNDILTDNHFYRVATACINNTYQWGQPNSGIAIPIKKLCVAEDDITYLSRLTKDALLESSNNSNIGSSPDLKVGSMAYAMMFGNEYRNGPALDLIYFIRNPTSKKAFKNNKNKDMNTVIGLANTLEIASCAFSKASISMFAP